MFVATRVSLRHCRGIETIYSSQ
ncbi:Protein of unknown function [Pyronema omphalodes CBS 100304]|uniref:Uncharacterized protein n=1 Tax=Pyronema omphalodes (strain CBS 100304) TaxID=1076935 RepID=U4L998_PYROM|nr:Protein of unknown function [Pyronema omphalodes CBS 100304]